MATRTLVLLNNVGRRLNACRKTWCERSLANSWRDGEYRTADTSSLAKVVSGHERGDGLEELGLYRGLHSVHRVIHSEIERIWKSMVHRGPRLVAMDGHSSGERSRREDGGCTRLRVEALSDIDAQISTVVARHCVGERVEDQTRRIQRVAGSKEDF